MICHSIRNNNIFTNSFVDWIKYLKFEKTYKHSEVVCWCLINFHKTNEII